ncbi:MAG: signal peptidase [Planctomycetes bacterium]|nr:signal peptidase [Planctomycetota bacterium]
MVLNPSERAEAEQSGSSAKPAATGGGSDVQCGNGLEKIYPKTVIRYGYMKYLGEFSYPDRMKFTCGARVIVQTHRGIELGEQMSTSCGGCSKSLTREKIQSYVEASDAGDFHFQNGRILREARRDDLLESEHIRRAAIEKLQFCNRTAQKHNLKMKLVECEHLFGGERIVFYFMSDRRVDFRDLVRELSQEFQTRIEMRQIGARDQARLVADYETCGRECCCKVFLKTLKPVSMKMAKLQKATLDPSKVSGRCGRLKCCLRYEHQSYEELERALPKVGKRVQTPHGDGVVINRQILTQLVQIETDDRKRITVPIEDVGRAAPPASEPVPRQEPARPPVERSTSSPRSRTDDGRPAKPVAGPGSPDSTGSLASGPATPAGESAPNAEQTSRRRPGRRRTRRRRGRGAGPPSADSGAGSDKPSPS